MLPALVAVVHPLVSKMDFQFTHYQGNVSVKCSMEHIALANWFNTEVRSNPKAILTALSTAQSLSENQENILIGAEYTLFLDADEWYERIISPLKQMKFWKMIFIIMMKKALLFVARKILSISSKLMLILSLNRL